MNDTFIPRSDYSVKKWYILDAKKQSVGRVATVISNVLQGKHKVDYHPSVDVGDYIIVINATKICFDTSKVKYHVYSPVHHYNVLHVWWSTLLQLAITLPSSVVRRQEDHNTP